MKAFETGMGARAVATYAGAAEAASAYLAARHVGDSAALARLTAPIWHAKTVTASDGARVLDRATLLSREAAATSDGRDYLSSITLCGGDFAVARADRWAPPATTFMLLFKDAGAWRIVSEASAEAAIGQRDKHFMARDSEREVLDVLETYYRGVTEGDPLAIRRIFASCWHMKNHENNALVSEDTDAFAARLTTPLPTYWSDRQISDVQIAYNRLAFVRVDRPSTPGTTAFLFVRDHTGWSVIDKAWTDGRDPPL